MGLHSSGAKHPLLTAREVRNTRRLAHGSDQVALFFQPARSARAGVIPGVKSANSYGGIQLIVSLKLSDSSATGGYMAPAPRMNWTPSQRHLWLMPATESPAKVRTGGFGTVVSGRFGQKLLLARVSGAGFTETAARKSSRLVSVRRTRLVASAHFPCWVSAGLFCFQNNSQRIYAATQAQKSDPDFS